jgi:hypothetical protein
MSSVVTGEPGGPVVANRRVLLVTAGFAAVSAAGLVNNYSSLTVGRSLFGSTAFLGVFGWLSVVLMLLAPIAAMVALWLYPRGAWAWLLIAGAVLTIPITAFPLKPSAQISGTPRSAPALGDQLVATSALVAPTLTVLGLLAAGMWLGRIGLRGTGALLAGLTVGLPTLGLLLLFSKGDVFQLVIAPVAVIGAIGAVSMLRFLPGGAIAESRPDRRVVVAGIGITVLPAVSLLVGNATVTGEGWFLIGLLILNVIIAALSGTRPALGAVIIALAGAGTIVPTLQASFLFGAKDSAWIVVSVTAGVAVGLVISVSRYRVAISVAGLLLVAVLTFASTFSDKYGTGILFPGGTVAGGVAVIFLLMAVMVAKTAAVSGLLHIGSTSPVSIGIMAPALNNTIFAVLIWSNRSNVSVKGGSTATIIVYGVMLIVAAGLLPVLSRMNRAH